MSTQASQKSQHAQAHLYFLAPTLGVLGQLQAGFETRLKSMYLTHVLASQFKV